VQRVGEVEPCFSDGDRILPPGGCFGSEDPKCRSRDEMSLMVEGVVDGGMDVEKPLRASRRLEPLHLALPSPHDLMEVFSAIVFSEASDFGGKRWRRYESWAMAYGNPPIALARSRFL
jgi:hypothetical protein